MGHDPLSDALLILGGGAQWNRSGQHSITAPLRLEGHQRFAPESEKFPLMTPGTPNAHVWRLSLSGDTLHHEMRWNVRLDFGHPGINPLQTGQERAGAVWKLHEVWWESRHHEITPPPMPLQ